MGVDDENYRTLTPVERVVATALRLLPLKHGKHRLLDHILPKPLGMAESTVPTAYHGRSLLIDIDDLVGWHFAMLGSFDPEVTEVLVAASGAVNEVFWDVGANKGACSYAVAVALRKCRIVAIEPQGQLAANLVHNLGQVCPSRFEHHPVGLSTSERRMKLTIPDGNRGRATLHPDRMCASGTSEFIHLVTATSLQARSNFGWPTLVKIDVEGHEPEVIESLQPCIASHHCRAIVFENHAAERDAFASISKIARESGYRVFGIGKTPFATRLAPAETQLWGITDYVMASPSVVAHSARFRALMAYKGPRRTDPQRGGRRNAEPVSDASPA